MKTKETTKSSGKPFIIANPIYDTVFKRLMENQRIAKFFLSTILERQIEDLSVLPQKVTYKIDKTKAERDQTEVSENVQYYSFFRLDFVATIRHAGGKPRKILIELQKSWDTLDVVRFRKYLGTQYSRVDNVDGKEMTLPITTIYILGNNLAGIDCPCVKVGRTYTDMLNKTVIDAKSEFIEHLTHDSYVIQAGRITDVRYTTTLDKLLSIFEQNYFIVEGSDVRKEYPYQPDDEDMTLITDILYEMGADPEKRKDIEAEVEALRIINNVRNPLIQSLEEKNKTIEEQAKSLEEKANTIEEQAKENAALRDKIAAMERLLRDKPIK